MLRRVASRCMAELRAATPWRDPMAWETVASSWTSTQVRHMAKAAKKKQPVKKKAQGAPKAEVHACPLQQPGVHCFSHCYCATPVPLLCEGRRERRAYERLVESAGQRSGGTCQQLATESTDVRNYPQYATSKNTPGSGFKAKL